ncbi:MAG: LysM peptidoglycan-binding domain-containing protein [Proteobacteria bacterium]|nr:LysM peptidoglycan-binding domain-containing protein [Pseudomonadota bacterium]
MKKDSIQRIFQILLFLFTIVILNSCASSPLSTQEFVSPVDESLAKTPLQRQEVVPPADKSLADVYRNKALDYEKAEEILKAIEMWKIVSVFSPADREAVKKIDDLQKLADNAAENHFKRGVTYFQEGAGASARKEFLLTLLFNPDHAAALDYLKNKLTGEDYIQHGVMKGETLQGISQKYYNDPKKDFFIAYFNDLDMKTKLVPGTSLKIPVLETLTPGQAPEDQELPDEESEEPLVKTVDIEELRNKGAELLNVKKYLDAIAVAESVLKYNSNDRVALNLLNESNYQLGKIARAETNYDVAIKYFSKVYPGYRDVKDLKITTQNLLAESHYKKGVKFYLNEQIEQAISEWEETLTLNPKHPRAQKNIEKAQNLLKKIQKLNRVLRH